jgi:glutamate synthase (NADPH/NADH) small chain
MKNFDAVCIAVGAGHPRDIHPEGRELKGIYFALDFLANKTNL